MALLVIFAPNVVSEIIEELVGQTVAVGFKFALRLARVSANDNKVIRFLRPQRRVGQLCCPSRIDTVGAFEVGESTRSVLLEELGEVLHGVHFSRG